MSTRRPTSPFWRLDPGAGNGRTPKGNKHRDVFLTNGAKRAMDDWAGVRGSQPGPLLVPVDAFGGIRIRRLHVQTKFEICNRLAVRAGIVRFARRYTPGCVS